jgi:hypothetical protein
VIFIIWHHRKTGHGLSYFCIFFCFSVVLAIGFSVKNLGAIVRARSIIMPGLVVPMLASLNWEKLGRIFQNNINNKRNLNNSA